LKRLHFTGRFEKKAMQITTILSTIAITLFSCNQPTPNTASQIVNEAINDIDYYAGPTETINSEKEKGSNMEIVFCLDATGSMSGLIGTAKEKIWDIVSELAQSNKVDSLKMGMVFYRDRGDLFVTKQIQLTNNLDNVYSELLEMNASGGGDTPESVNQALYESVNDMQWSEDEGVYKTIFVVGDCPPHMDYKKDASYTISCKLANSKGIIINTIKLGEACTDAIFHFKKMADCSQGEYLQLDQNATDYVVETPYDDDINEVSRNIDDSRMYYGNKIEQSVGNENKRKSIEVYDKASVSSNSSRASYKNSKVGGNSWMGAKEVVEAFKNGKLKLEELEEKELPKELRGITIEQKKKKLNQLRVKRDKNVVLLKELSEKRKEYINDKKKEIVGGRSSFSETVIEIMKDQSEKGK